MALSKDLIAQFVKITNDKPETKKESVVYGTIVESNGSKCVQLDGSDIATPIQSTTNIGVGDRVTVMIKNHTAIVTGNLSNPSARFIDIADQSDKITQLGILVANKVDTKVFVAEQGRIDSLVADNVLIKEDLIAQSGTIKTLTSDNATIKERLTAAEGDIGTLKTEKLSADSAEIKNLQAGIANIGTLIFGSASGNVIQTSFANAVIAQLGDAQIKSAMIESISAAKITAGDIITNNVRIKSEDGNLIISDETIQISDDTRVRVQIGKDAANDYSINVWDADGNLMFSEGGITDSAIKTAIIRNDMVSDTANIHASKLDIDSLFSEINGSTNTIKSTKIYLDENKQTLDVAFKSLSTTVTEQGGTISSQGTAISTIQGQIKSKIWQQDIDTAKDEMSTQYSTLEQTVDSFKTTVGETYATKQSVSSIKIGGRNLLRHSDFSNKTSSDNITFTPSERMVMFTSDALASSQSFALHLSNYGLSAVVGETITFSGEYMIPSGLEYGTTNPFIGCQIKLARNDTTGGASQYITWLGSKNAVGEGPTDGWVKYAIQYDVSNHECSASSVACLFRDVIGTIYFRNLKVEIGTMGTDWTPAPEDIDADISALNTRVTSNESSITQLSDRIATNVTETTNLGTRMTTVEQTASDLSVRIDAAREDAASTATNYLNFSDSGLIVGDHTKSSLGKNVLIDSEAVKVRTGTTVNAIFGADIIELAKSNESATISMLNGAFKIYYDNSIGDGGFGIYGRTTEGQMRLAFQPVNENNNLTIGWGGYAAGVNSTNLYGHKMYLTTNEDIVLNPGSGNIKMDGNVVLTNGKNLFGTNTSGTKRSMAIWNASNQLLYGYGSYTNSEGSVFYDGNNITMRSKNDITFQTVNESIVLQDGDGNATYNAFFRPASNAKCTLGTNANRWYAVYASNATIQTSDVREKENIASLDDKHSRLFDKLRPVQFNFINGNGRLCYGLVAQEVLAAMSELDISEHELDLVHHDTWVDDETQTTKDSFGLAYTNLIAMLIYEVQKLKHERRSNYA